MRETWRGGFGYMVNAINQITDILTAMGAKPETIVNSTGETIIKVNAPIINNERIGKNEKTENKKIS